MNKRHKLMMAVWAVALLAAVVIFRDRLFPGQRARPAAGVSAGAPSQSGAEPKPSLANTSGAQEARLRLALKAKNPGYDGRGQFAELGGKIVIADLSKTGVTDLSPLRGLPLEALDVSGNPVSDLSPLIGMSLRKLGLEGTKVADLSPLGGMPLTDLYLNNAPVKDLSPLKGLPLRILNLFETQVEDLSPLVGMGLESLWLNGTRVKDISPLRGCPLVSLTVERTPVADLSPLAGGKLERLHIGQSGVTDLSPIGGLALTRLIFTPERITKGVEVARGMPSIREIGTTLDGRMPPPQFWQLYDQGRLAKAP